MRVASEERKEGVSSPEKTSMTTSMVRVVTSDGNQLQLPLSSIQTFANLSETIESKLGIPPSQQRILYGFPPKELQAPGSGHDNDPLPFQHGDKVTVENVLDSSARQSSPLHASSGTSQVQTQTSDGVESEVGLKERMIWHKLQQDMENSNVQRMNAVITSLMLSATLNNTSLWSYAQTKPELFRPGGLFYLEVERDIGLVDGKHCSLPLLPEKIFRYSAERDQLELCLEPFGHFAVAPGIEEQVSALHAGSAPRNDCGGGFASSSSVTSATATSSARLAGSSGVVLSKSRELLAVHTPFQGQGHVLSGSTQHHSVEMLDLGNEDEKMDAFEVTESHSLDVPLSNIPVLTRKAPGVSVLNPIMANYTNQNVERLETLAQSIKDIVRQEGGQDLETETAVSEADNVDVTMSEEVVHTQNTSDMVMDFYPHIVNSAGVVKPDLQPNEQVTSVEMNVTESLISQSASSMEMKNTVNATPDN